MRMNLFFQRDSFDQHMALCLVRKGFRGVGQSQGFRRLEDVQLVSDKESSSRNGYQN